MKTLMLILSLGLLVVGLSAQTGPSAQKAKKMVGDGLAYFQKNGQAKAIEAFNDVKGPFRDGEFYLFMYDIAKADTAVCLARGDGNKSLIGKDMWKIKDPDGQLYIQAFAVVAKSKAGFGWVDYKRTNPESKKIEPKSSYISLVPGTEIFIGCGFYKD